MSSQRLATGHLLLISAALSRFLYPEPYRQWPAVHENNSAAIRLIWLVDIAKLLTALPAGWDWQAFIQDTIARHLAMPIFLALSQCQAHLAVDLPAGSLDALRLVSKGPQEQDLWRFSAGGMFTARGLWAHVRAAGSATQAAAFVRGVLLPGPARIREYSLGRYGRYLPLWRAYLIYFNRLGRRAPELMRMRRGESGGPQHGHGADTRGRR